MHPTTTTHEPKKCDHSAKERDEPREIKKVHKSTLKKPSQAKIRVGGGINSAFGNGKEGG